MPHPTILVNVGTMVLREGGRKGKGGGGRGKEGKGGGGRDRKGRRKRKGGTEREEGEGGREAGREGGREGGRGGEMEQ